MFAWVSVSRRKMSRLALRLPKVARLYRSARREMRQLPSRTRRALVPAAMWGRRLPLPSPLLRTIWWMRTCDRDVSVPMDRLLLGGENGLTGADYAELTDQPMRTSTPIGESGYVKLLEKAGSEGGLGEWFLDSEYLANGRLCVEATGHYFGAVDDEGITRRALSYVSPETKSGQPIQSGSPVGQSIRVRPIRRSEYFEIVDGHHRLAQAWVEGRREIEVDVQRGSSSTALQELLNGMSWIDGQAELYQPVAAPDVSSWNLVRHCTDRLHKMQQLLADEGVEAGGRRYLDVGSCYGWFVHQMGSLGWDATGIELDPKGPKLGEALYGLDASKITVGDCASSLTTERHADIVSCFSVLHHFVLGRGSCSAEELLGRLDATTGTVLFLDTGQNHEQWFAETLPDWDPDFIDKWILDNSSFRHIARLGVDEDSVPPYHQNYGRMLFACTR